MGKQPALSVVHHHWFPHENEEQEQKLGTDDVSLFRPEQCFWLVENLLRIRSTTQVWIVIHHQYEWEVSVNAGLREGLVSSFPETYNRGADLAGGCRGCTPPPPPDMTCDFLIQVVFCQKKNYVVYWYCSRARDECTPSCMDFTGSKPWAFFNLQFFLEPRLDKYYFIYWC